MENCDNCGARTENEPTVLCDACMAEDEMVPVARVEKHTGQFKDMAVLVWLGEQPAEGTILYAKRAV